MPPIGTWIQRATQFYRETQMEMRQVTWPGRREVMATTVIVLVTVLIFAGYLYIDDEISFHAVRWVFERFGVKFFDAP